MKIAEDLHTFAGAMAEAEERYRLRAFPAVLHRITRLAESHSRTLKITELVGRVHTHTFVPVSHNACAKEASRRRWFWLASGRAGV